MARKSALGSGLDSIFDDSVSLFAGESGSAGIQSLLIGEIEPNREQPRKNFDETKLEELASSIKQHGIVQPITVREHGESYQIVAGERRWRAARIAGLEEVPVRIMELTDVQTMQIALIENLQREDLNPIEEAQGYRELISQFSMTQEQVSGIVGRARSSVANALRLLTLPEKVLELVQKGQLSKGHCKAIMSATSTKLMISLAERAAAGELTVRDTERLARETLTPEAPGKPRTVSVSNTFYREAELALAEVFNTKIRIVDNGKKKSLCIDFSDDEELKNIIKEMKIT
jgi:ParB family chromosome partitioning protein